ncbi:MAG: hemolysin family protein [Candidatus Muiribacteriota bacterium]
MEETQFINAIIIVGLLLFSAYFSGSETAFFSIDKFRFNQLIKKSKSVYYLLEKPRKLLVSILLGNLFVNVLVTITATSLFIAEFGEKRGSLYSSIIMTFLLLLFGEIIPKVIAVNNTPLYVRLSAPLIKVLMFIFTPLSSLILHIVNKILKIFGLSEHSVNQHISQDELKTIIDMGNEEGVIKIHETQMLRSVFEFSDTSVAEIMTPRIDMVCIDVNDDFESIKNLIKQQQFSRIPVFDGDLDNIIGILYVKDILPYLTEKKRIDNVKYYLRKAFFVPESKGAYSLLKYMQKHKTHIVIVSDEYGGNEGLVTMEDIIEELVGEIHDEYDEEDIYYKFLDKNKLEVSAKININELNDFLNYKIIREHEDFNTLGGYILHKLGNIPEENDTFEDGKLTVKVLRMEGNRIDRALLIIKDRKLEEN